LPPVDHFTLIAPYYDRIFPRPSSAELIGHLEPRVGDRVLDVGGGTGRVAERLARVVRHICVLDPSAGMLVEGRRKGLCVTRGEAEALPYTKGAFDRIVMVDAFHHLRDQSWAATELMRVLAPGGRVVIEEPNIAHLGVRLVALGERLLFMRSRFRDPHAIRRLFEARGGHTRVEQRGHTAWIVVEKA
jgi:demethylmenaquinone methyltransferase/2-methoxy-6-polyprenyl-1,4-benzoquinol methylase